MCGPVTSIRGTDNALFVNVGKDYPSPERFAFVIWGDWWMDPIADDAIVCAAGTVYLYEGVTQMELGSREEIEIWR